MNSDDYDVDCAAGVLLNRFDALPEFNLSEGKTTKQALKCVQRRLVNIIFLMMKNKTEYQNPPTRKLED